MAIITFENHERDWLVARWAFRQLFEDVVTQFPDDVEMDQQFRQAIALDGLHFTLLEPDFANRIADRIRCVAMGILKGTIHSTVTAHYPDAETPQMYREGLLELVKSIDCKTE
jgi:hypothetical protein